MTYEDDRQCLLQVPPTASLKLLLDVLKTDGLGNDTYRTNTNSTQDLVLKNPLDLLRSHLWLIVGTSVAVVVITLLFCYWRALAEFVGLCAPDVPVPGRRRAGYVLSALRFDNRKGRSPSGEKEEDPTAPPSCKNGAVTGAVSFEVGVTKFSIISHQAPPEEVLSRHIFRNFRLHEPNLLISVMGGAGRLKVDTQVFDIEAFCSSLVSVAIRTDAWVVTGGTSSGVMDLVGQAMQKHDKFRRIPCIGITSFGALTSQWRSKLLSLEEFSKPPDENWSESPLAEIQQNHTHSILCDDGSIGTTAFGKEAAFRASFENMIAHHKNSRDDTGEVPSEVPRAMLLVNGGKFSLMHLEEAIRTGCAIIVCKGSGRCADAIATLLESISEPEPSGSPRMRMRQPEEIAPGDLEGKLATALQHFGAENLNDNEKTTLINIVKSGMVWMYALGDGRRLEDVILQTVLERRTSTASKQLTLAVQWGCFEYYDLLGKRLSEEFKTEAEIISFVFTKFVAEHEQFHKANVSKLVSWLLEHHRGTILSFDAEKHLGGHNISFHGVETNRNMTSFEGLVLWSLEKDAPIGVLEALWMQMGDPIHSALVIAGVCRRNIANRKSQAYKEVMHKTRLEEICSRFEQLAIRVLQDLVDTMGDRSIQHLFDASEVWHFDKGCDSGFMLAHALECRAFVANPSYRLAMEQYYLTPNPFHSQKEPLDDKFLNWYQWFEVIYNPASCNLSLNNVLATPFVKSRTHTLFRFFFIILYVYGVFSSVLAQGDFDVISVILFLWALSFAFTEARQLIEDGVQEYFSSIWNVLDFMYLSVLITCVAIGWCFSLAGQENRNLEHSLKVMHSLNLWICWLRLTHSLLFFEYFGVLVITVFSMFQDAFYWFVLVGFFIFASAFSLTPILMPNPKDRGVMWAFWSLFAEIQDPVATAHKLPGFTNYLCEIGVYMLCFVANVLLVNLLIAIMSNTYEKVQADSHSQWAFIRMSAMLEYAEAATWPQPFNTFERLWLLWRSGKQGTQTEEQVSNYNVFTQRELQESKQRIMIAEDEAHDEIFQLRTENKRLKKRVHDLERVICDDRINDMSPRGAFSGSVK